MKIATVAVIVLLCILLTSAVALSLVLGRTPTPTPTLCEADRDSIQLALDAYHAEQGDWPTADGQPGDIDWEKMVPDFMDDTPLTDINCDWAVNRDPQGEVCVPELC